MQEDVKKKELARQGGMYDGSSSFVHIVCLES